MVANEHILRLRPIWINGTVTFEVTYPSLGRFDIAMIERLAEEAGYLRAENIWSPTNGAPGYARLFKELSARGIKLEYQKEPDDAPFNLQRLNLEVGTRTVLESLSAFQLDHLSGWTPVQAEGEVDGHYFYFRARYAHWRFEVGGNESGSRSPRWWHEEAWPTKTGFGAGYMSDEEAISCILKAVHELRHGDRGKFRPGDPRYEHTLIEGWSLGALGLRTVSVRLGITPDEVVMRAKELDIELPYTTEHELKNIKAKGRTIHRLRLRTGVWSAVEIDDANEDKE